MSKYTPEEKEKLQALLNKDLRNTFHFPTIGAIVSTSSRTENVVQFLGIKYASLEHLFAPSKIVEYIHGQRQDGMKLGPMVPGPPGWDNEFGFIQKSLPMPEMKISELDGLNLNITIPSKDWELPGKEAKLPVFVFVHGGGFALGANSWPTYNQKRFVESSTEMGMPLIAIGINYRVGIPGFLTSAELRGAGLGLESNNGIRDQMNAFRWVKRYIGEFGGDAENVTFCGESAGSVSGCFLLHQKESFFKRYISMSGTTLMMEPQAPEFSEFVYGNIMHQLGLGWLSGVERVEALMAMSTEKLIEAGGSGLPIHPVIDGEIIPCAVTFGQISKPGLEEELPGRKWCEELLVGDCQFDGSIISFMLPPHVKADLTNAFRASIFRSLGHNNGSALLDTYHIGPEDPPRDSLFKVLQFATDIGFYAPALTLARGWSNKAYLYHFNEPNPWEGEFKGRAGHVLDVAYLFQNYAEHMDDRAKGVAKDFAETFIKFTNGKIGDGGLKPFSEEEGAIVFGGEKNEGKSTYVKEIAAAGSGRDKRIWELGQKIGLEELSAAWGNFLGGK